MLRFFFCFQLIFKILKNLLRFNEKPGNIKCNVSLFTLSFPCMSHDMRRTTLFLSGTTSEFQCLNLCVWVSVCVCPYMCDAYTK